MKHARRYRLVEVAVPVVLVVGSLAVGVLVTRRDPPPASVAATAGQDSLLGPGAPPHDLSALTDEQLESTLAAHPRLMAMRLTLVERYLREGKVKEAEGQAHLALQRQPGPRDRPAVLKYLGWSVALLGRPAEGAKLLEESIRLNPDDPDTRWFLANVAFRGLGDASRASALLEELLRSPMPEQKRGVVEAKLAEARAAAGSPSPGADRRPGPRG
jgi:cytochrome c-type biogenesis protein CcmH/NrfG